MDHQYHWFTFLQHNLVWATRKFLRANFEPPRCYQTLKEVAKFDLPGPGGKRFDYLTIDDGDHYLISAHLAAEQTYVIDLRTNKVIATVADTPGVEGTELHRTLV
jgi:hypothetical protein